MRLGRICKYDAEGFDLVKSSGLSFLEICCNYQKDAEACAAAEKSIKENIARTGIDVSSIGRWNHDVQENGKIVSDREDSYFKLLDTAMNVGAKTFVCGINYDESISLYKNYVNALSFFSRLIKRAEGSGVKVSVQNCSWNNFVVSPREWEVVMGELKDLWIKFDPSHSYNRGGDYLAELSDWCNRVSLVHIKGTVHAGKNKVDDPPAGMDDIKWRSLFAILYARKYNGDLSIEPHSATWQGELGKKGVDFTAKFIKEFIL